MGLNRSRDEYARSVLSRSVSSFPALALLAGLKSWGYWNQGENYGAEFAISF